jgi:hypothetical protein
VRHLSHNATTGQVEFNPQTLARPVLLKAQTPVNSPLKAFEMEIQDFQQQIGVWQGQAHTQIVLLISIAVIGVLISALQGLGKLLSKFTTAALVLTVLLGLVVSVCTGINTYAFSADYRSLRYAAIAAG